LGASGQVPFDLILFKFNYNLKYYQNQGKTRVFIKKFLPSHQPQAKKVCGFILYYKKNSWIRPPGSSTKK
jgi:hypothetical protein